MSLDSISRMMSGGGRVAERIAGIAGAEAHCVIGHGGSHQIPRIVEMATRIMERIQASSHAATQALSIANRALEFNWRPLQRAASLTRAQGISTGVSRLPFSLALDYDYPVARAESFNIKNRAPPLVGDRHSLSGRHYEVGGMHIPERVCNIRPTPNSYSLVRAENLGNRLSPIYTTSPHRTIIGGGHCHNRPPNLRYDLFWGENNGDRVTGRVNLKYDKFWDDKNTPHVVVGGGHMDNPLQKLDASSESPNQANIVECKIKIHPPLFCKWSETQKEYFKKIKTFEDLKILKPEKNYMFFYDLKVLVKNECYELTDRVLNDLQQLVDDFSKKNYKKLILEVRKLVEYLLLFK
jgi:hypothetical protein